MRIISARWTPQGNELHVVCDECGCNWWIRADRWNVRCPCCGIAERINEIRDRYLEDHTKMKRYLVFMGDTLYPVGGWEDYQTSFAAVENCFGYIAEHIQDWWHIVDSNTGKIIHSSS